MKSYAIDYYLASEGCTVGNLVPVVRRVLHEMAEGRICTTGCQDFNSGTCIGYKNLTTIFINLGKGEDILGKPVRQE